MRNWCVNGLHRWRRASPWLDSRGGCRHMSFSSDCPTKAITEATPISHRSGLRPAPSNAPRARPATVTRPAITIATSRRSLLVCARMADVPNKLSTGVLSQNSASAASSSSRTGRMWVLSRNATPAPVTMGTSKSPHAPCSRGNISARRRSRRAFWVAMSSAELNDGPEISRLHSFELMLSPEAEARLLFCP